MQLQVVNVHARDTHPRVGIWRNCPSIFQHHSLFNVQCYLLPFKHHFLVGTNFGSTFTILAISSLKYEK